MVKHTLIVITLMRCSNMAGPYHTKLPAVHQTTISNRN